MKRPMLAASASMEEMERIISETVPDVDSYWIIQPKLDGIRAIFDYSRIPDECLLSRKGLPIPNKSLCRKMGEEIYKMREYIEIDGLEGEIILDGGMDGTFQNLSSVVNSEDFPIDELRGRLHFVIFDNINRGDTPYKKWFYDWYYPWVNTVWGSEFTIDLKRYFGEFILPVGCSDSFIIPKSKFERARSLSGIIKDEEKNCLFRRLNKGGELEGFIFRKTDSPYKHGRSTLKEGGLIKVKKVETVDCEILEICPKRTNLNAAEKDELGYTKRSTKKDGYEVDSTMAGSLRVREMVENGKEFKVNALDLGHEVSKLLASDPQKYIRDFLLEVKYNSRTSGGIPRFPKIQKLRNKNDA